MCHRIQLCKAHGPLSSAVWKHIAPHSGAQLWMRVQEVEIICCPLL